MEKGETVNVRLPKELSERFRALAARVPGLPKSVLMRLLLKELFEKPIDDQVEIVTRQILKKPDPDERKPRNRVNRNTSRPGRQ